MTTRPDQRPLVSTPPGQRWHEFRLRYLPGVIFALGLIATAVVWRQTVAPTAFEAEAEIVQTEVRSPQTGIVADLKVALLQPVTAGQGVAEIRTTAPTIVDATLAMIRAEVELLRTSRQPVLQQQRVELGFAQLELDWMHGRVTLASLRSQLQQAEVELTRIEQLFAAHLVTDDKRDTARNLRDGLVAQVEEQTRLVSATARVVEQMKPADKEALPGTAGETLRAALRVQEERLRLVEAQLALVPLKAPIDGVVATVLRRDGETVRAGDPVMTIAATRPERLVGFLRQPLPFEPRPGMRVEVQTHDLRRRRASTTIAEVGRILEPVWPTLALLPARGAVPELGLRIHIRPPATLALRPGEHVDVIIRE